MKPRYTRLIRKGGLSLPIPSQLRKQAELPLRQSGKMFPHTGRTVLCEPPLQRGTWAQRQGRYGGDYGKDESVQPSPSPEERVKGQTLSADHSMVSISQCGGSSLLKPEIQILSTFHFWGNIWSRKTRTEDMRTHQPDSPCCLQTQRLGHRPPAQRQADSLAWPSRHACLLRSLPQTQNTTFQISLHKSALPGKSGSCLCWLSPQLGRLLRRKGSRGCRRERENIGLIFREHASKDFQQQRLMTDLLLANTALCS